jgi:hypothetical protein
LAHCTLTGCGQVTEGAWVSTTVITCEHEDELPQSSVAVQVRVIVYCWAQEPGVVDDVIVTVGIGSQLSVAVGIAGTGMALH